jgi:hypothetical protein
VKGLRTVYRRLAGNSASLVSSVCRYDLEKKKAE